MKSAARSTFVIGFLLFMYAMIFDFFFAKPGNDVTEALIVAIGLMIIGIGVGVLYPDE